MLWLTVYNKSESDIDPKTQQNGLWVNGFCIISSTSSLF